MSAQTPAVSDPNKISIDAVFFAQTHVQEPHHPYFRLVGEKDTLIKVHILSSGETVAPPVRVDLKWDGATETLVLAGPQTLPTSFNKAPGQVVHRFDDCFTATIPGKWIRKGLTVTIRAGEVEKTFDSLCIGPPIRLNVIMFDVHYFEREDVDYPENWAEEIAVRRPVTEMKVQRLKQICFPEVIIPPFRRLHEEPAVLCTSEADYEKQVGKAFHQGHTQEAAFQWAKALQDAGGQRRLSLFLINIANIQAGGFAEPFHGCSSLRRFGVLHHELGHALDVEDLSPTEEPLFPYRGAMHGIERTGTAGYHVGPSWGYDPRVGVAETHKDTPFFINPVITHDSGKGDVGEWKNSPVKGGGGSEPEAPQTFNMYSDWSVRKMQVYMERRIPRWEEELQGFRDWNDWWDDYRIPTRNDGVTLPIEHEVEVYSIMVSASGVTPAANFIYPLIGPYTSGLIATFDPEKEDDRKRARRLRDFGDGWDVCLRVVQGGVTKTYMVPIAWRPDDDPTDGGCFQIKALNLPVRDGDITRAELLFTPDAEVNGLPDNPAVLYARDCVVSPTEMERICVDFGGSK